MEDRSCSAIYVGKTTLKKGAISPAEYAESTDLHAMLTEITKIFLRKNGCSPQQTVSEYLQQCNRGEHVLLKSFNSFNKSALNRICFFQNFLKIFEVETNSRNGLDYYQLFRLLCSDFPKQIIQKTVDVLNGESGNMNKLVTSKKFINSFFMNFIYTEYLDNMLTNLFEGSHSHKISYMDLYVWLVETESKIARRYEKPPFHMMIQLTLDLMKKDSMLLQESKVIFVTQQNCEDYIQSRLNQYLEKKAGATLNLVSYQMLLEALVNCQEHQQLVKQNLEMFDNSAEWANNLQGILTLKEVNDMNPLNTKKVKTKKSN